MRRVKTLTVVEQDVPEFGVTNAQGVHQHGLKYRLHVSWRRANNLQYFGARSLSLKGLGELLLQFNGLGRPLAGAATCSARRRALAAPLLCRFTASWNAPRHVRPLPQDNPSYGRRPAFRKRLGGGDARHSVEAAEIRLRLF